MKPVHALAVILPASLLLPVMTGSSGVVNGSYSASFGDIFGTTPAGRVEGLFAADGTLHSGSDLWQQIPVDQADPALVTVGCGAGV